MQLRTQLAFDGADDVHDMRVTLDGHQLFDFDRTVFADAAYIVAAEIDEHDVLGSLLFIMNHFVSDAAVVVVAYAARACSGDGAVLDATLIHADQYFRRRASNAGVARFIQAHAQKVEVRRGVDDAQRAIDGEGIDAGFYIETLG